MEALVLGILIFNYIFSVGLSWLNQKRLLKPLPIEVADLYTIENRGKSVAYSKTNFKFSVFSQSISLVIMLFMIVNGGFNWVNEFAISKSDSAIIQSLIFFGVLLGANQIISWPLSYYSTFVIEEKFGFNNSTKKLFFTDTIKKYVLGTLIGGGLLALLGWLIETIGSEFWFYFFLVMLVVIVFINAFYTSVLLPVFNKLSPIQNESLNTKILDYCNKVGYNLTNLYQMDGSKRSKKANAFFSGLGPKKTVVLYDTLIDGQKEEEIVAVLAHEIGHYKKKHTFINLVFSIAQLFLMLLLLGYAINQSELTLGIGVESSTFYTGLFVFTLLYSPLSLILGTIQNVLSRKMEYQADEYAATTNNGEALIDALKKLSVDNLSNLNPHPLYVFIHHSHPTLVERMQSIRSKLIIEE